MEDCILVAASPQISSQAINFHLDKLPDVLENDLVVLKGNQHLEKQAQTKWKTSSLITAKSRAELRNCLKKTAHLIFLWDGKGLTELLFEARLLAVRTKVIPIEVTLVVNKTLTNDYDVYIGRGSMWGNPFAISHGEGPDREEVINRYKDYFEKKLAEDPSFKRGLSGLRGLRLACFCKPQACHGDVIADYLDRLPAVEKNNASGEDNNETRNE